MLAAAALGSLYSHAASEFTLPFTCATWQAPQTELQVLDINQGLLQLFYGAPRGRARGAGEGPWHNF